MKELAGEATSGQRERGLYDRDFWAWTEEQAGALRRRDFGAIDWDNLIEEVETLGRSERSAWTSNCMQAVAHLLKIEHYRSVEDLNHWRREVGGYRRAMHRKLQQNLGMKGRLSEMLAEAWRHGRAEAVADMAEYDSPEDAAQCARRGRFWDMRLPAECPHGLVEVAGYDPFDKQAEPRADVWPPGVARVLNEALGTDFPVRRWGPEREGGRSR